MQVGDVMHTDVKSAESEDTFADVAKTMRTNGISSVVVLDGKKLAGIVTERDIVNLVAAGGDPHSVKVAHGMTRRDLETVGPKMDLADAA
jgi:CBS domain-containing protein